MRISCLITLFLLFGIKTFAQSSTQKDISNITLDFFKATRPLDNRFTAYTAIQTNYGGKLKSKQGDSIFRLTVKIFVIPDSTKSYFRTAGLTDSAIKVLLHHESVHIKIGLIIGNLVEKALNEYNFSKDYQKEIDAKFREFYQQYRIMHDEYDQETAHGLNLQKQTEWDEKIRERERQGK